ncbi:hypothetical protein A3L09_00940 [Thermococcus profundus]|uniref:Uncharacterized protein n=1 Tax=Thermococcus profundus TaxID=49899 RepID=A0A2Z2M8C7_THEPR|nr:hypothetical protein [Thermococcus profundus]ASJ01926.1 hypothetical protein A3L09_00940 [Thermococcus profundus]
MLKKITIVLVFTALLMAPAVLSINSGSPQQHGDIYPLTVNPSEIPGLTSDLSFQATTKGLKGYSLYAVDLDDLLAKAETGSVTLEIRGRKFELVLTRDTSTLAPGATDRPIYSFRGSVKGVPESMVALTISDRAVFVTVWVPNEWYYLRSTKTKLDGKPVVVGYSSKDEVFKNVSYRY